MKAKVRELRCEFEYFKVLAILYFLRQVNGIELNVIHNLYDTARTLYSPIPNAISTVDASNTEKVYIIKCKPGVLHDTYNSKLTISWKNIPSTFLWDKHIIKFTSMGKTQYFITTVCQCRNNTSGLSCAKDFPFGFQLIDFFKTSNVSNDVFTVENVCKRIIFGELSPHIHAHLVSSSPYIETLNGSVCLNDNTTVPGTYYLSFIFKDGYNETIKSQNITIYIKAHIDLNIYSKHEYLVTNSNVECSVERRSTIADRNYKMHIRSQKSCFNEDNSEKNRVIGTLLFKCVNEHSLNVSCIYLVLDHFNNIIDILIKDRSFTIKMSPFIKENGRLLSDFELKDNTVYRFIDIDSVIYYKLECLESYYGDVGAKFTAEIYSINATYPIQHRNTLLFIRLSSVSKTQSYRCLLKERNVTLNSINILIIPTNYTQFFNFDKIPKYIISNNWTLGKVLYHCKVSATVTKIHDLKAHITYIDPCDESLKKMIHNDAVVYDPSLNYHGKCLFKCGLLNNEQERLIFRNVSNMTFVQIMIIIKISNITMYPRVSIYNSLSNTISCKDNSEPNYLFHYTWSYVLSDINTNCLIIKEGNLSFSRRCSYLHFSVQCVLNLERTIISYSSHAAIYERFMEPLLIHNKNHSFKTPFKCFIKSSYTIVGLCIYWLVNETEVNGGPIKYINATTFQFPEHQVESIYNVRCTICRCQKQNCINSRPLFSKHSIIEGVTFDPDIEINTIIEMKHFKRYYCKVVCAIPYTYTIVAYQEESNKTIIESNYMEFNKRFTSGSWLITCNVKTQFNKLQIIKKTWVIIVAHDIRMNIVDHEIIFSANGTGFENFTYYIIVINQTTSLYATDNNIMYLSEFLYQALFKVKVIVVQQYRDTNYIVEATFSIIFVIPPAVILRKVFCQRDGKRNNNPYIIITVIWIIITVVFFPIITLITTKYLWRIRLIDSRMPVKCPEEKSSYVELTVHLPPEFFPKRSLLFLELLLKAIQVNKKNEIKDIIFLYNVSGLKRIPDKHEWLLWRKKSRQIYAHFLHVLLYLELCEYKCEVTYTDSMKCVYEQFTLDQLGFLNFIVEKRKEEVTGSVPLKQRQQFKKFVEYHGLQDFDKEAISRTFYYAPMKTLKIVRPLNIGILLTYFHCSSLNYLFEMINCVNRQRVSLKAGGRKRSSTIRMSFRD